MADFETVDLPPAADQEIEPNGPAADLGLSFVIPAMDEEESLAELHRQITEMTASIGAEHQIIFIDDGSTDATWSVIEEIVARDPGAEAIRFRRNFGKAAALDAGFAQAEGEIVFTMDADLQDDPKEIPRFLEKLDAGYDVVSGWKQVRHDPWHKVLPSRVFNWLVSSLTGVVLHDHNCGFKAYRRGVVKEVELYGERHRFVPVLAAQQGWRVSEISVEHHARQFGRSKYGVTRLLKGFLDLLTIYFLTGFGKRPLHLVGTVGMAFFAGGGLGLLFLSVYRIVSHMTDAIAEVHLHQRAVFYYCIVAVLLGGQFLVAGLLAELIVSQAPAKKHSYRISERIGPADNSQPERA